MAGPHWSLIICTEHGTRRIALGDEPVTIGRHPQSRVCLDDDRVSRHHCVIRTLPDGFELVDLGSRNGTKINGLLATNTLITPGDQITIGGSLLRLELYDPTGTAPPPTPPAPPSPHKPPRKNTTHPAQASMGQIAAPLPAPPAADRPAPITPANPQQVILNLDEIPPDIEQAINHCLLKLAKTTHRLPPMPFPPENIDLIDSAGQRLQSAGQEQVTSGLTLLRALLLLCMQTRATDLHLEPRPDTDLIRLRIDGMMADALDLPATVSARLAGVVKVLCQIDITRKQTIQEGHFSCKSPDRRVDYRVSFTPSIHGQKLVIRVLDLVVSPQRISDLMLPQWMAQAVRETIRRDSGMVLVCGPTGSGKTTTLYSIIRDIDRSRRNVITIEDPVEFRIDGVTQLPINEQKGNTFSELLRSVLRQDPDVILLGEIRDTETARIALQASLTGHLVFSTVHARDVVGTVFRLMDLGVEPTLIANALNIVIAQRLIRQLCPHCKRPVRPSPQQITRLGTAGHRLQVIYEPAGCIKCFNTGYHGRRAVFELLSATEELRNVLLTQPTLMQLRKSLGQTLFHTLRHAGDHLVAAGITCLDEVDRVIGPE